MPAVTRVRRPTKLYAKRAKRLVVYRVEKNWSWGAIAEKFGMHRANVRKIVLRELEKANAAQES